MATTREEIKMRNKARRIGQKIGKSDDELTRLDDKGYDALKKICTKWEDERKNPKAKGAVQEVAGITSLAMKRAQEKKMEAFKRSRRGY